jgi:hypothetical protein
VLINWNRVVGQLNLPLNQYYHSEAMRIYVHDTTLSNQAAHQSLKPISDKRTEPSQIFTNEGKYYYWITQKLFKENFIIFEGKDYWCSIDPIVDLEMGTDFSADSLERLFWNTRGIRVQGRFFDQVGFSTVVYENQAILPHYQRRYAADHGEFFPNSINTKYQQNNAVIPGYARTKIFKTNGFDFGFAEGYVSYYPSEHFNIQLGNGNHFIGNGYRSLLLSDFTTNYPFLKIETNLWQDRIQYNAIYAIHQNLYRLVEYTTPEATYERKIGTYHYLDLALPGNVQLGFFEGNLWRRVDSTGSHPPDYLFTNPLPFINSLIKKDDTSGFAAVLGINLSATIGQLNAYSQVVFTNGKPGGFQVGAKYYDLFTEQLDLAVEYNRVALNAYLHPDKRYNYSHFNLPLAHPFVNGFQELSVRLNYQHNRFFVTNNLNYSQRLMSDSTAIGNHILEPIGPENPEFVRTGIYLYNQLEIGYRFNKAYNLQFFVGHLYRNQNFPAENPLTNYAYIGLRTQLKNKYRDY